MRRHAPPAALLLICTLPALTGCVLGTEKPLYDRQRDSVFDPRLVGEWRAGDDDVRIVRAEEGTYRVDSTSGGRLVEPVRMELARVGNRMYLFPVGSENDVATVLLGACQIEVAGSEFRARFLNTAELLDRLYAERPPPLAFKEANPKPGRLTVTPATTTPATRPRGGSVILTDAPEKIRAYLIAHQDDAKLFEPTVAARKWVPVRRNKAAAD